LYFEDSVTKLHTTCLNCPIKEICQGGRLVHRFKKENGFNNVSVYCNDLIKFIAHVQHCLMNLFPDLYTQENVESMDADEIINYVKGIHKNTSKSLYRKDLEYFGNN